VWRTESSLWSQKVKIRSAVRYPKRASVLFTWQGPEGTLQGEGVTRDISRTGVYTRTATSPPLSVAVHMEIFLRPLAPEGKPVKMLSEGQVIRVEHPIVKRGRRRIRSGYCSSSFVKTKVEFGSGSDCERI
jgi:hypothetical protein